MNLPVTCHFSTNQKRIIADTLVESDVTTDKIAMFFIRPPHMTVLNTVNGYFSLREGIQFLPFYKLRASLQNVSSNLD